MHFAVGVDGAGRGAFDGKAGGAAADHRGVAVERTAEEAPHERGEIEERERRDRGEVEQAVVDARAGGDEAVVAVLVGVANDEREGAKRGARAALLDDAGLGRVVGEGPGAGRQVAGEPAPAEEIETRRDFRLEAEPRRGEKRPAVGETGVDEAGVAGADDREGVFDGPVDAEVAAEAVAGSAGDQAESGGGSGEDGSNLIERAVAADGDDHGAAVGEGLLRECGGMAGGVGERDAGPVARGEGPDRREGGGGAAGAGVDDEAGFQREIFLAADCADGTDKK